MPSHHRPTHPRDIERKNLKDKRLDRKSGMGIPGAPKKGGGGGKFTWGSYADEVGQWMKKA